MSRELDSAVDQVLKPVEMLSSSSSGVVVGIDHANEGLADRDEEITGNHPHHWFGMGEVGKITLAQKLYADPCIVRSLCALHKLEVLQYQISIIS